MTTAPTRVPAISVLVPCCNDAAHLDRALASLAAQTFADFEAVIADDASSDGSVTIAERWCEHDPRFRLVRNATNLGMTENWNRALSAARGGRVAKLDADDLFRPAALERLSRGLDSAAGVEVAFCRAEVGDAELRAFAPWPGESALRAAGIDPGEPHVVRGRELWLLSLADVQLWHSNAFLVGRDRLLDCGGFDQRWSCASDTALFLRLVAGEWPVALTPYVGVVYRRRAGSVSATFERHGWKSLEALLVRLDSLARDGRRLGPLPRAARQAWWQTWRGLERVAADPTVWRDMPPRLRSKLEAAVSQAARPPLAIRVEGALRLQAWRIRARVPGSVGS